MQIQRRILSLVLTVCLSALGAMAQSSMTDQQVLEYGKAALKAGKSQKAIATELVARGVTREQAERVKAMYERREGHTITTTSIEGGNRSHVVSGTGTDAEAADPTIMPEYAEEIRAVDVTNGIYGRNVFSNRSLNFAPSENLATPLNYTLGPGDEVIIDIFGANQTTLRQTISPEGSINVDVLGPVYLNGKTIEEANSYLKKRLASIYAGLKRKGSTDIRLSLGQIRTIQINMLGDVAHPGTYVLSSLATVFHALYRAGGIVGDGTLRDIVVTRGGRTVAHCDVYDFLLNGSRKSDVRLQEGDVVLVRPYSVMVSLKGKVKRPMKFEMREGETLQTLLGYAGGFAQSAYTKSITVVRQNGREYEVCTVDEFDFASFKLKDGDEIEVGELLSRFENRVEISGSVYKTGIYQLDEINTVRTLVEKADGLLPEAFTSRAVLHRERQDRSLEVLAVDLKGILDGTVPDIALRNNDVLYVPSIYDLKDMGTITVNGEVTRPGTFPFADNTTLEDIILQAGGLTEAASLSRVDVSRRVADPKATKAGKQRAETFSFSLKDGFVVDGTPGFVLQPYDIVTVRRMPGYSTQEFVSVTGQTNFTGQFTMTEQGMRVSQLVEMAGGLTDLAYVKGARLERRITVGERRRMHEVLNTMQHASVNDTITSEMIDLGNTYYVGIELDKALANPGSNYDVVLRQGDHLDVPLYSNVVRVAGAVISPNTVNYEDGKRAKWYIENAGGYTDTARKSRAYAIKMNGHIQKVKKHTKIEPGSEIIVPSKQKNPNALSNILGISTTSASVATMIATIANILK